MDHRDEYRDNMSSPQSHTDGQWSPPPRFSELDQIHEAPGSPQTYSPHPHSPHVVSPPLHEHQGEFHGSPQSQVSAPVAYHGGYSTEKETPYATTEAIAAQTPDYSGPQVVPGQFDSYPHGGRPMSPPYENTTLMSPQGRPYTFKEHVDPEDPLSRPGTVPPPVPPKDNRKCGMKKRNFFILIGCLVILIVALALGLGLGLGLSKKEESDDKGTDPFCRQKPEYCIGGSLNANYFSKKGVFNGTGIALAGESWNVGQRRIFTLYFQHHTGDIRYMQYGTDQKWTGGSLTETIATGVKDASPISAVSFGLNGTQQFHVFYIDTNNTVRQTVNTNTSNIWSPGPLNALNLKAMDSPSSGLQACWKGNYYGDSDYSKFPTANGQTNTVPFDERLGMNLWYAVDETTFQQYVWYNGQDTWVAVQPWRGFNAHAGVGCYSWGAGTTTYAMMANTKNDVEFWWKDTNTTTQSSENHPINSWVNSTGGAIDGVNPITSLGYTTYFYAQMADRSIQGYSVNYNAENTSYAQDQTFTISDPAGPALGLAGTHLTVTSYAMKDGNTTQWDSLYVFYQTQGDDITAFTRPIAGGQWTRGQLTIPDQ